MNNFRTKYKNYNNFKEIYKTIDEIILNYRINNNNLDTQMNLDAETDTLVKVSRLNSGDVWARSATERMSLQFNQDGGNKEAFLIKLNNIIKELSNPNIEIDELESDDETIKIFIYSYQKCMTLINNK